ncbi:polyketide synthetase [Nemania sp. FL0031]|nr:polyketide synthetase [Nemania sp. FL0031]
MTTPEPIAIIGTGFRFPGNSDNPSDLWENLRQPHDLLVPIPDERFSTAGFYHQDASHHGHTSVRHSYLLSGREHLQFDAQFFGISPAEANALDPQVRLLLETVYEALERSGLSMDSLRGSDTAVYAGQMLSDYEHIMSQDKDFLAKYHATGTSRAMTSNRISYFFDWHGPSMTIDTACSSSLYAVHYAIQQLRQGSSQVAVATGTNLLLDPSNYISENKLNMLSPHGRSRMWDIAADGYARGEGVAAVVLKTLSAAIADGDHIECIIRETGVNQDGKTKGITLPSAKAQVDLIRDTYTRAGLNLNDPLNWPQFFEAHGTGTPGGDPIEAEAIHTAFFGSSNWRNDEPMLVGSFKTIMGHTEGTAGLAGLLRASLAIQNSTIPPNLLFNRLNPRIEPFYHNLKVPVEAQSWPALSNGIPRRASVNSFGFGGANAHAIIESYDVLPRRENVGDENALFSPFIFSAASSTSLSPYLKEFCEYLKAEGAKVTLRDLAYTLHSRRTRFRRSITFSAQSASQLLSKIETEVKSTSTDDMGTQSNQVEGGLEPRILAIFTGQGAQWARMGAELIAHSPSASKTMKSLEDRLARLPSEDRPSWSLTEELLRSPETSRINTAAISQPLCTAIQIFLVDILRAAQVQLTGIVGHSSGEIAAAYAAGLISAEDAISIAYYRGLYAHMAGGAEGEPGAMIAAGTSAEDIEDLLREPEFEGRAHIAAINSLSSVTVSGDAAAIEHIMVVLKDEKKFVRLLKVDKAYHSHHMRPCSAPYLSALDAIDIQVPRWSQTSWYSSVNKNDMSAMQGSSALRGPYWESNMVHPVLFMQAVENAVAAMGDVDLAIEIGAHPALKGPAGQVMLDATGRQVPYTGLLKRGLHDLDALADGLGYVSQHLGKDAVNYASYESFMSGAKAFRPKLVTNLPSYCWNHKHEYWHESRLTRAYRRRQDPLHELLGHVLPNSTEREMIWRNVVSPKEIPWMKGHRLQNQIVFPAAGYVAAALEASLVLANKSLISAIELLNLDIHQALAFDNEDSSVETICSLMNIRRQNDAEIVAEFAFSADRGRANNTLDVLATGSICIRLGEPSLTTLPPRGPKPSNLIALSESDVYEGLAKIEYHYSDHFVALHGLERKLGVVTGMIRAFEGSQLLLHPAPLDAAFQSALLALSAPNDGALWSIHVPKRIRRIRVNPQVCMLAAARGDSFPFDAFAPDQSQGSSVFADVDIFSQESNHTMVQVEGVECVPLSPFMEKDDKVLFYTNSWGPQAPDAENVYYDGHSTAREYDLACRLERVAYFYLRRLLASVPLVHPSRREGSYVPLFNYATHITSENRPRSWTAEWESDTIEKVTNLCKTDEHVIDFRLLDAIGRNLTDIATGTTLPIETGMTDDLLGRYYKEGLGMSQYSTYLVRLVQQLIHLSPRLRCLEIGAGTGGVTKPILQEIGRQISSYTFTDVSSGFFPSAKAALENLTDSILFEVLDISRDPTSQGFEEESYDLVIASMVLHATPSLSETLKNARRLLKPGGYLIVLEIRHDAPVRMGTVFGAFPGWWLGQSDGRQMSPAVHNSVWDSTLRESGFSGCDTMTPEKDGFVYPLTIFVSQAVDASITYLRNPLASSPKAVGTEQLISELLIVGGASPKLSGLIGHLESLLWPFCGQIQVCHNFSNTSTLAISTSTTVLSLVDLEELFFRNLMESEWDGLRALLQNAGAVLWATQGRRSDNPHANLIVGLIRSVRLETPGLEFQSLDFEDLSRCSAEVLANALLRFEAALVWKRGDLDDSQRCPFTLIEPEIAIEASGQAIVPRIISDHAMNNRYNSAKRPIFMARDVSDTRLNVEKANDGNFHLVSQSIIDKAGPRRLFTHSLLSPMKVCGCGPFYLSLGLSKSSTDHFIALSTTSVSEVDSDTLLTLPLKVVPGSEASFLQLVQMQNLAHEVLDKMDDGEYLLVHEANPDLQRVIRQCAGDAGIRTIFTTTQAHYLNGYVHIHPNAPKRVMDKLQLESTVSFLDLSTSRESRLVAHQLRDMLPMSCRRESINGRSLGTTRVPSKANTARISRRLCDAIQNASRELVHAANFVPHPYTIIKPGDLSEYKTSQLTSGLIIDWTAEKEVLTKVEPIDSRLTFSQSKTYWLAGLSGSLGISLCQWMINHGARHVVISSRRPKIEDSWLRQMAEMGATVKVMSCDMTNEVEVTETYDDICSTLPPIAGVVNGAMVLKDARLADTDLETLKTVLRPKMDASIYLNNLFQKDTLDFFILFSSISAILGTFGQSSYSAANMFMASLVKQRRLRGLAGSVIHIGPVFGVGYIAQQKFNPLSLKMPMAYLNMSERDFHQLFAEGIMAGRSDLNGPIEIITGVRQVRLDEDPQPRWASDPIMSHYLLNSKSEVTAQGNAKSKAPLKVRLLEAQSQGQVNSLIKGALLEKLSELFHLEQASSMDQTKLDATRLDDLGIDSLDAIEIRVWLMKNLQLNYPAFKILGGISIGQLVAAAVEGVAPALTPNVELPNQVVAPTVSVSNAMASEILENSNIGSSSESSSNYDGDSLTTSDPSEFVIHDGLPETSMSKSENLYPSFSLSKAQSTFWISSAVFGRESDLNFAGVCRVTGPIDVDSLGMAVKAVGQRHESLRTRFRVHDGQVRQEVMKTSTLSLEHRLGETKGEISRTVEELQKHVFNLKEGETLRAVLISLSPTQHFLVLGTSHVCMDGMSFEVIILDVFRYYGKSPPLQRTLQYQEFVRGQERAFASGKYEIDFRYWKSQFPDFPPPLPILRVSRAKSRQSLEFFDDVKVSTKVGMVTKDQIQTICRTYRTTPFHFYLACFRVLLARYADDAEDLAIGIVDANRFSNDMMGSVGVFLNAIALRFRTQLSSKFSQVLQDTRKVAYSGLKHAGLPFQSLMDRLEPPRSSTYTPIFQTFLNYRSGQGRKENLAGCELELESVEVTKTGFDINIDIIDDASSDCRITMITRRGLYDEPEAEILLESYGNLVRAFATDVTACLDKPDLHDHKRVAEAMTFSQGPFMPSTWPETVIHQIDNVAQVCPDAVAVREYNGAAVTYSELLGLSNGIASELLASGVKPTSRVAILQHSTRYWIASILATLRVGAIYLPLDLSVPWPRLAALVKDCQPEVVLIDENTKDDWVRLQKSDMVAVNVSLAVPTDATTIRAAAAGHAMLLYTSGSSGAPKGILLRHEGIRNQIEGTGKVYGLGVETILQQTACTFDLSYWQIFTALCYGGSICLVPKDIRNDADAISELMCRHAVSLTLATPTEYSSWLKYGDMPDLRASSWKKALAGGEIVTDSLLKQFRDLGKENLSFFNVYGPTEATVLATGMELSYNGDDKENSYEIGVPAGRVLPNYSIYVVDENCRPVAPGVQGEVYIGGPSVADGYINNPELTATRFVPDVFAVTRLRNAGWSSMHRTGDLGRWDEDGSLLIEGRISGDTQIKLRGIRIDLQDIENNLLRVSAGYLSEVVVSVCRNSASVPETLVAHAVINPSQVTDAQKQQERLNSILLSLPLPRYMCPTVIIPLRQMPRTTSSKLDRREIGKMPLPEVDLGGETEKIKLLSSTEARLEELWTEIICDENTAKNLRISRDTDFFHVGGTSLLILELRAKLPSIFGVTFPVARLLENSTLGTMARLVEDNQAPEEEIDWDEETSLPDAILQHRRSSASVVPPGPRRSNIILTGATGYLGRAILDALIQDDQVEAIHCIGVRDAQRRTDIPRVAKVHVYDGELRAVRLGLSVEDSQRIFSLADLIIHNGAEVSHLRSYRSLKAANLTSTKQLIEMSLPRRVPLLFVSTAQVGVYYTAAAPSGETEAVFPEVSLAGCPPPVVSPAGYPAAKWASERFLERLVDEFKSEGGEGWPIIIHRPPLIARDGNIGRDVVHNLRRFSAEMGAVPRAPHFHGFLQTVTLRDVVDGLMGDIVQGSNDNGARYVHYSGRETLSLDHPKTALGAEDVIELPFMEWANRAGEMGLDPEVKAWVESALGQPETVFPRLVKGTGASMA